MATKATDGGGTVLAVGATPTAIGEIQSVKQSGAKWDTEEATNMGSTAKEFVALFSTGESSLLKLSGSLPTLDNC
jgi:hypothetical protein